MSAGLSDWAATSSRDVDEVHAAGVGLGESTGPGGAAVHVHPVWCQVCHVDVSF